MERSRLLRAPNKTHPSTRIEKVRRLLVKAAVTEFIKRGYDRTSITDLSQAFGLSQTGMYHYFGSKEDIIDKIIEFTISWLPLKKLLEDATSELGPKQAITKAIKALIKYADKNQEYYAFLTQIWVRLTREQRQTVKDATLSYIDFIKNIIQSGIREGVFATDDPDYIASEISMQAYSWALRQWHWRYKYTLDDYIRLVTKNDLALLHCSSNAVSSTCTKVATKKIKETLPV